MRPMTVWLTPFFTACKENMHVMRVEVRGGRSLSHHNNESFHPVTNVTIVSICALGQTWLWPLSIKCYSAHPHIEIPFISTSSFIYCSPWALTFLWHSSHNDYNRANHSLARREDSDAEHMITSSFHWPNTDTKKWWLWWLPKLPASQRHQKWHSPSTQSFSN